MSYAMASLWLFLAWAGWVIAVGGLAGVQARTRCTGKGHRIDSAELQPADWRCAGLQQWAKQ